MQLRAANLQRLKEEHFDVLIIGAGINGAASAAALAGKGARVALIDRGDFAGETSQHSSNLVWGGIKYMESYDFSLVRKLCKSRNHLIRSFPSTVQEIRLLTTIDRGFRYHPRMLWAGTWLYWLMGNAFTRLPRYLTPKGINRREPLVDTRAAIGGFEYSDAYLGDNDITFQYIDVDEHDWATAQVEAVNDGKRTIPTILIGETWHVNPDNPTLRDALGIEQERSTKRYDTLIIGAGATGLTAAIYLQRAKRNTVLLEAKNVGGNAFLTSQIENYPGILDISGPDLMDKMAEQARSYGAQIEAGTEVTAIEPRDGYFAVSTGLADYEGRTVVVATGSQYRRLEIPGEEELIGSGVHFCATCDAPFYKGRSIIVVGGGNSGLEEGLYLTEFASDVTFVTRSPGFTAEPIFTEKLETIDNATALLNKTPTEFVTDDNGGFHALRVRDNETGEVDDIAADGAFVFIGLTPNTEFLSGMLDLDEAGYVDVAPGSVETNVPGIFAAGDCRKGAIAQVAAATGEGVVASFAVNEYLRR